MHKYDVAKTISRGVGYIDSQQLASGGFVSFSSPSLQPFETNISYQTVFTPALILSALSGIDEARAIREGSAKFLLDQISPSGSFNYWTKQSAERQTQPYPDDLDDTFCALSALFSHDPKLIDEAILAKSIKLLLATETKVGGPYRTWLVPAKSAKAWLDVDLAVNANIAYFISLVSQPLPNLTAFIDEAIAAGKIESPYYPSDYSITYYLARAYSGQRRPALIKVVKQLMGEADTALDLALSISALARLGVEVPAAKVKALVEQQAEDGSWPAAAFCHDPAIDKQPYYSGSAALTTAFAIEALGLVSGAGQNMAAGSSVPKAGGKLKAKVLEAAKLDSQSLQQDVRRALISSIKGLADSRSGAEIVELANNFNQSLTKPLPQSNKLLVELGLANLYGWLAYMIYDDFLDQEGHPELLSIANVAMRKSLELFLAAQPANRDFQQLVRQTFDTIDGANAWELANCRFLVHNEELIIGKLPNYGSLSKLAERSLGHTLGPLTILSATGTKPSDAAFKQLQKSQAHYLIARQLNDDLHDWSDDLKSGHITYVLAHVLDGLKLKPGGHQLADLMPQARKQFWYVSFPAICDEMKRQIKLSRQALAKTGQLQDSNILDDLLNGLEQSIVESMSKQAEAVKFLKHYSETVSD